MRRSPVIFLLGTDHRHYHQCTDNGSIEYASLFAWKPNQQRTLDPKGYLLTYFPKQQFWKTKLDSMAHFIPNNPLLKSMKSVLFLFYFVTFMYIFVVSQSFLTVIQITQLILNQTFFLDLNESVKFEETTNMNDDGHKVIVFFKRRKRIILSYFIINELF